MCISDELNNCAALHIIQSMFYRVPLCIKTHILYIEGLFSGLPVSGTDSYGHSEHVRRKLVHVFADEMYNYSALLLLGEEE